MTGILRHYISQNKSPPPFEVQSPAPYVTAMWSHSSGDFGGIFDNAASSSEGSLLVDILVIMLRLDAIMHCGLDYALQSFTVSLYSVTALHSKTSENGFGSVLKKFQKSADGSLSLGSTASAVLS